MFQKIVSLVKVRVRKILLNFKLIVTLRGAKRGSAGVPLSEIDAENMQMDPKSTPYSSQIAPKCISNASKNAPEAQGMPRRQPGAFQRRPKCAPEHPKALQKVPQRL